MKSSNTAVVGALIALLVSWGVFGVLVFTTNAHNSAVAEKVATLEMHSKRVAQAQSLKTVVTDTADERASLKERLLQAEGVVDFIKTVESLAKVSNTKLTIDAVEIKSPANTQPASLYESLVVSLSAQGTWASLMHLVSLVEALPVSTSIDRVSFSLAEKGGARASVWNASLQFSVVKEKAIE